MPEENSHKTAKKIESGFYKTGSFVSYMGAACMVSSMCITFLDVILRYLFNKPIPGSYYLTEFLLVGMVALPIAFCQHRKLHIRVDIITARLTPKTQIVMDILTYIPAMFLFALATMSSWTSAWRSFVTGNYVEAVIRYPLWPSRTLLLIGVAFATIQLLVDIILLIRRLFVKNISETPSEVVFTTHV